MDPSWIYKPENIVFEAPFLSTSTNDKLRFAESDANESKNVLRYTISSKNGIAIKQFSTLPNEDEVLFAPGSVFRVLSFSEGREVITIDSKKNKVVNVEVLYIGLEEIDHKP